MSVAFFPHLLHCYAPSLLAQPLYYTTATVSLCKIYFFVFAFLALTRFSSSLCSRSLFFSTLPASDLSTFLQLKGKVAPVENEASSNSPQVMCLYFSLSVHTSACLYTSTCLYILQPVCSYFSLSVHTSACLYILQPVCTYFSLSVHTSACLYILQPVVCLFQYLCAYVYVSVPLFCMFQPPLFMFQYHCFVCFSPLCSCFRTSVLYVSAPLFMFQYLCASFSRWMRPSWLISTGILQCSSIATDCI